MSFLEDVLAGLSGSPKTLPCKYLYDKRGSELFEQICDLDDYYPTRADLEVTQSQITKIVRRVGPRCRLVELGSGSSTKTRVLLDHLPELSVYIPVDISEAALADSVAKLRVEYPDLELAPLCADYSHTIDLPSTTTPYEKTVMYFPGSTIGNFHRPAAGAFVARMCAAVGSQGAVLIGVDIKKDKDVLERAYDDSEGVTAAFNMNLLARINRELGADFDLDQFAHQAIYDEQIGRIEMHLVSQQTQRVTVGGSSFEFVKGDSIRTEESYKYSREDFAAVAKAGGMRVDGYWTDSRGLFSLQYLVAED